MDSRKQLSSGIHVHVRTSGHLSTLLLCCANLTFLSTFWSLLETIKDKISILQMALFLCALSCPNTNALFLYAWPVIIYPNALFVIQTGAKSANKGVVDYSSDQLNVSAASPDPKNEEVEEHQDIDIEELFGSVSPENGNAAEDGANAGFDISMRNQNESDNEIADVDDSGDEVDKGPNAAEALRAQVNAEGREKQTSTSGSSSGSGSSSSGSGSGSSSSSSDNEGSDDDSVNSIWEIEQPWSST